jgi:hypothetical protein
VNAVIPPEMFNITPLVYQDKDRLKEQMSLEWVLRDAGVDLVPDTSGSRLIGWCPFEEHTGPKFGMFRSADDNLLAGCWVCTDKHASGDLFDVIGWLRPDLAEGNFQVLLNYAAGLLKRQEEDAVWATRTPAVLRALPRENPAILGELAKAAQSRACGDWTLIQQLIDHKTKDLDNPGWKLLDVRHLVASWYVGVGEDRTITASLSNPDSGPYPVYTHVIRATDVIVPHLSVENEQMVCRGLKHRRAAGGMLLSYEGSALAGVALYGAWRVRPEHTVVVLCEGESDAWIADAAIRAAGLHDWVALALQHGAGTRPVEALLTPLIGRSVVLAFDNDKAGRDATRNWLPEVKRVAADVRMVRGLDEGQDLGNCPDIPELLRDSSQLTEDDQAEYAQMVVTLQHDQETAHWLWREIGTNGLSGVFRRGDQLVHTASIGEDGYIPPPPPAIGPDGQELRADDGPVKVRMLDYDGLASRVTHRYRVDKWTAKEDLKHPLFPSAIAKQVMKNPDAMTSLRTLRGVTHVPMPRADGSLITSPGFDDASGYLYIPTVHVGEINEHPEPWRVENATAFLEGMVSEFVWTGPHDKANFFGMLLTPLLRLLTPPPYKFALIDAHQPGSGKSLLSSIITEVHGKVFRPDMPTEGSELEKQILSILLTTTAPVVLFDNLSGVVRSPHLAGLLTSADYSGRVLGITHTAEVPNDRMWMGNGNNIQLGGDMARRALWCRIDPGIPNPHLKDFKLDIPQFLQTNRGNILRALLLWVSNWRMQGGVVGRVARDSYGTWISTTRQILGAAGVSGTFDYQDPDRQETAADDEGWGEFLMFVYSVFGEEPWSVKELLARCEDSAGFEANPLYSGLIEVLPGDLSNRIKPGIGFKSIRQPLGHWVKNKNGRWVNGLHIVDNGVNRVKSKVWSVKS